MSLSLIGSIRGLLPFSGVTLTVLAWKFMSVHLRLWASPMRAPVSLRIWSMVANLGLHDAISMSISFSVGMNGMCVSALYVGLFHLIPLYLRYASYCRVLLSLVTFLICAFAITALTSSGLVSMAWRANSLRVCTSVCIVSYAFPSFLRCMA
jgi:hypothetical protein